jgi:hypothetical protein
MPILKEGSLIAMGKCWHELAAPQMMAPRSDWGWWG